VRTTVNATVPAPVPVWTECDVDLEAINACTIKRLRDDTHTIIGYRLPGADKLGSWYLPCPPAKHQELVARFTALRLKRGTDTAPPIRKFNL
jgi:hypothetical protein